MRHQDAAIGVCVSPGRHLRYSILKQSLSDLSESNGSPSISMGKYLIASAQTHRFDDITVYVEYEGMVANSRSLYLNDFALTIWREMKRPCQVVGRLQRPPLAAVLSFGKRHIE